MTKNNSTNTRPNYTGTVLENFIETRLIEKGYEYIDKKRFQPAIYLSQAIFTKQFGIGKSIYGTDRYCDFLLFHPKLWPETLVIESKWQQSSGSTDEKFPFTILNIKKSTRKTVLVLDGGGYKKGAEQWVREQTDDILIHVFSMAEFQKWANRNRI